MNGPKNGLFSEIAFILAISANISLLELSACIVEIAPGDPEGPRHENSGATTWLLITGP